ncbi:MAG: alpha/beta hydrolase [Nitrosomonadales bacterium]|nr:alpha/beta hydrolase [Nitrosomonadales bacterium]
MGLHKFDISAPAGTLEGAVHIPDAEPLAIAIIAHPLPTMGGTMENKVVTTLAKTFAELGFIALRFNFRGVGDSSGAFDNGEGEMEDALAVARHAQMEYGHLPLVLAGFSFGAYVQACAAQLLRPRHLVLIAPATGRFEMPHVPHATLVIHGEQDEVVPLADVMQWARPQHLPVVVLPEAGHFFHGRLNQIREIVSHYFSGHDLSGHH